MRMLVVTSPTTVTEADWLRTRRTSTWGWLALPFSAAVILSSMSEAVWPATWMCPTKGTLMRPSASTTCSGSVVPCAVDRPRGSARPSPNSVAGGASQMLTSTASPIPIRLAFPAGALPSESENVSWCSRAFNCCVSAPLTSMTWIAGLVPASSMVCKVGPEPGNNEQPASRGDRINGNTSIRRRRDIGTVGKEWRIDRLE